LTAETPTSAIFSALANGATSLMAYAGDAQGRRT
jgi:hypothetical protein